jgi:dipeptidyl aminopeptidase/acylaminoacyl peptidase
MIRIKPGNHHPAARGQEETVQAVIPSVRMLTLGVAVSVIAVIALGAQAQKRPLALDDLAALREVGDPHVSPDGAWVAYVVRTSDVEHDRLSSDIWMVRWDASETVQLTHTTDSERQPRWSPDGRSLAFLAARGEGAKTQVWVLSRSGGEARAVTSLPGGVSDFAWAPDGRRLALIGTDPDPADAPSKDGTKKTAPPIVVDRYQFKQDGEGYLTDIHDHLYVVDLGTGRAEQLSRGAFDDALPSWSPDGRTIAISSKREGDPDRHENWDIYLVDARPGGETRKLTTWDGADNEPGQRTRAAWSPDGKAIAYLQGGPPKYFFYDAPAIASIPAGGGVPRAVAPGLDRGVRGVTWSDDGRWLYFTVEEDRTIRLARVAAEGGSPEPVSVGRDVVREFSLGPKGRIAVTASRPDQPYEVMALEGGTLRPLTAHNRDLMQQIALGPVDGISARSKDGTTVHAVVIKPPGFAPGTKYPTIAYIHGGAPVPFNQDTFEFRFLWHYFASRGYVVVAPNYRGSSGRERAFIRAIFADWGHLEVEDVLAAVDYLVASGVSDPQRLGIGGWSYGGLTTNYTIATDRRFKAAVSGASESNMLAVWGTDQYIRQYDVELGAPWTNLQTYMKLSYPFYQVENIKTPTLFMCGEKDFNVPLLNSEQMYQALRATGVATQLVIYPGQFHGLTKPSYLRDRLQRHVEWYDRFVLGSSGR